MIIVIPFHRETSELAEKLLSWVYTLNDRKKQNTCILIAANGTHDEFKIKVRLSAEVTFKNVELLSGTDLLLTAMEYADANLKSAWLYLSPDSVPIKPEWLNELEIAYRAQPKKIFGAWAKTEEKIILHPNSIYPADMLRFKDADYAKMSTKSPVGGLIQVGRYEKRSDILPETMLYLSDKTGELIKTLRKEKK